MALVGSGRFTSVERVLYAPRELPPLSPDVSHDVATYSNWVQTRERERSRGSKRFGEPRRPELPALHLVTAVADAPLALVRLALEGLHGQTESHWTLQLVCREEQIDEVDSLVGGIMTRRQRRRVSSIGCAATNLADQVWEGVTAGRGSPVALLFPGDVWAPDAVALLRRSLSPTGVVYADDDVRSSDGTYRSPRLKPDYSPDLLLASSYIAAPFAVGSEVAHRLPRPVGSCATEIEHEVALAACEAAESVHHIAEVLCHRSWSEVSASAHLAEGAHVQAALDRRGDPGEVTAGIVPGTYRILRSGPAKKSVSILVPFRDEPRLLRTCIDSVTATTSGHEIEFVLIDNGSSDPEILTLLERLDARSDVRVLSDPSPFNWAALNNTAARVAGGDVLLFLNNDIEAFRLGWLAALVGHACRSDVGAVGARLVYRDRRLQHCGVVVGLIGAAGHPLIGLEDGEGGYMNMALVTRECSAVTGACLASRREVFDSLGGFDESLGVDLNDVDYCLRGLAAGYRTVYEPGAELVHHESPSRGTAGGVGDILKFIERWRDYISAGDPYLNMNLTRSDASCGLRRPDEKDRWNHWFTTLETI
jgi:GT2 family glycosyltransferase